MRRAFSLWTVALVLSAGGWLCVAPTQHVDARAGEGSSRSTPPRGPTKDPLARLNDVLETGERTLAFQSTRGYLDSVLAALDISPSSQSLVFSKTSRQRDFITPETPRALYFNDTVAVGWVPGGDALEFATTSASEGVAFYTLEQRPSRSPRVVRGEKCSQCHLLPDSGGTLGLLMMSVLPQSAGNGSQPPRGWPVDQATPIADRWGGWYVTGSRVPAHHLGNVPVDRVSGALPVRPPNRALQSLTGRFDTTPYLSPRSDVVALLVLTHQIHVTNAVVRLNREVRRTDTAELSPQARMLVAELVDALVFENDAPLPSAVSGGADFVRAFESRGRRDRRGRSLRDLDLGDRIFRYPLSYLIDSDLLAMLPAPVRAAVLAAVRTRLANPDGGGGRRVAPADLRQAALEILGETRTDFETQ